MSSQEIAVVTAVELKAELESANPPHLLDVREDHELEISRLPGVVHIPLGSVPAHFESLDKTADWVVICRSGGRSAQATQYLMGQGFTKIRNLTGGMNGYARDADPSIAIY